MSAEEYSTQELKLEGVIQLESEDDFRLALSIIGFDREKIDEIASHEIKHQNEAQANGLQSTFVIQFLRRKDGGLDLYPSVKLSSTEDMTDD